MNNMQVLRWIYRNSKKQLLHISLLIVCNMLFAGCGVLFALVSRHAVDGAVQGDMDGLIVQGLILFMIVVMQCLLRAFCRSSEVKIQGRLEMAYRERIFAEILQKDYTGTAKYHSGDMMNRLINDVKVVSEGTASIIPNFVRLIIMLLCALTVLCIFDLYFGLVFAAAGVFILFSVRFLRRKLMYLHKNMQEKDGRARSFMQEALENMIMVKTFNVEHEITGKAVKLLHEHYNARIKKNNSSIMANAGLSFIFSTGYLYALIWCSFGLIEKSVSFGTLAAVLQLVGQVQVPFSGLSGLMPKFYDAIASAERMIELEDLPDEPEDCGLSMDAGSIYAHMLSIVFKNVTFRYERDIILNHVDLSINKGDIVGVFGISGIGKSTLLKLILGIFRPIEGDIHINMDFCEKISVGRHTRKLFAYVPQGSLLLSGTIRENISFAKSDAVDEEIMDAARASCAHEFIEALPKGLDTVIGEKGLGLSEGQAQRIAIARAILDGAPILILDEATSALDEAMERTLLGNIRKIPDKTCIIISHRKSVLAVCSKEVHIDNTSVKTIERSRIIEYHSA